MSDPGLDAVAGMFRVLADFDFAGASPLYHRLATAAADDPEVVALLLPAAPRDRLDAIAMPEIVFRIGLDRQPEDVADDDAMRWLRACIWPEQRWRAELFDHAVEAARRDPPMIVPGDVFDTLADVVRQAPPEATLCILHTAFINYLPEPDRFGEVLTGLGAERALWWVSGEPPGLVPGMTSRASAPSRSGGIHFLYGAQPVGHSSHEAAVLARSGTHGAWLEWLGSSSD